MSIDREFTLLNKTWNSWVNWKDSKILIEKWKNKPWRTVDFVKNSSLKYLIPALMATFWWIGLSKGTWDKVVYDKSRAPITLKDWDKNISSISMDEEFDYAPWKYIFQDPKENMYLTMFKKLSIDDYENMFKWLKKLRQWFLWNCYFVVALKNLARSDYFDTLMMTSIDKIGENNFNVYMPLWEPWWMRINVDSVDLKAATIRWPIWYKVLEIWFAKYLLFKKGVIQDPNIVMTEEIMKKMETWGSWETMMSLLGPKSFKNECLVNNVANRPKIINWLRNYNPKDLGIISVSSKFKEWKTDQNFYEVWWETIYYGHSYCICGVEKEWDIIKSVILENPWNNNQKWWFRIKLSIEDFLECFYSVNIGHITDNFLNFKTSDNETKIVDSINRKKS